MHTSIARFFSILAGVALVAMFCAGCGPSRGNSSSVTGGSGGNASQAAAPLHFTAIKNLDPNGQQTFQIINGARTNNEGLVYAQSITSAPGSPVKVELVIYFGPYGGDDNTLSPGDEPYLFPNYDQGAEKGNPSYTPVKLELVTGSGYQLWRATINNFPTTGRFVFTITKKGNSLGDPKLNTYMKGLQNDSSFDSAKSSLVAFYDSANRKVRFP